MGYLTNFNRQRLETRLVSFDRRYSARRYPVSHPLQVSTMLTIIDGRRAVKRSAAGGMVPAPLAACERRETGAERCISPARRGGRSGNTLVAPFWNLD